MKDNIGKLIRNSNLSLLYLNHNDTRVELNNKFVEYFSSFSYFKNEEEVENLDKVNLYNQYEKKLFFDILESILKKNEDVTVVIEKNHIDSEYTDSYYHHFSGLHYPMKKYCIRLCFFSDVINLDDLFFKEKRISLEDKLIGTMVIKPLRYGFIGRTLLDPNKFIDFEEINTDSVYIRLAEFKQHIAGIEFKIKAFPFSNQDSCYTTCAETTILNIMDYYSSKYKDYKMALPSEIKRIAQDYQYQRSTPSDGLNYKVVSKIFAKLGFAPRIYNIETLLINPLVGDERKNDIRRIMHYYIESGIPVAVNVETSKGIGVSGHSLICIGHSGKINIEYANKYKIKMASINRTLINSADYYTDYSLIDDHQKPYVVNNFMKLTNFSNMVISNLAIPLYKKMYMEATQAYDTFIKHIGDKDIGLPTWEIPEKFLNVNDKIVFRIYLASSRSLKHFKMNCYDKKHVIKTICWSLLALPQFVWCCELYKEAEYCKGMDDCHEKNEQPKAFAMAVLDATASLLKDNSDSLIAVETPCQFRYRKDNAPLGWDTCKYEEEIFDTIPGYSSNLTKISNKYQDL